jgi:hypothetical protein
MLAQVLFIDLLIEALRRAFAGEKQPAERVVAPAEA